MGNYYSYLGDDHYEKVREIKQMFCGKLDNFTIHDGILEQQDIWDNLNLNLKYIEKKIILPNNKSNKKSICFTLPTLYSEVEQNSNFNTFYSNIRLFTNKYNDLIKSFELVVGDVTFETINSETFTALRRVYNLPNMERSLPFHFCKYGNKLPIVSDKEVQIRINLKEEFVVPYDFSLKADVYELNNAPYNFNVYNGKIVASNVITQTDFHGKFRITNKDFKVPLSSRVITHLFVTIPNNSISELKLEFNNDSHSRKKVLDIDIDLLEKDGNTYIIPLTKDLSFDSLKKYGINFHEDNRHNIYIKLNEEPSKEQECIIFSLSTNIQLYLNGNTNLRYTK